MTKINQQKEELIKHEILKNRAKILAKEAFEKTTETEDLVFTEFIVAEEVYAIENQFIGEVCPMKDYTPLPGVPSYVFGIINVRGKIVSVIDIREFFNLPIEDISDHSKVIIIHNDGMEFGILADHIIGVQRCFLNELEISLPTLTDVRDRYLKGISAEGLIILDGEKLLQDEQIVIRDEV